MSLLTLLTPSDLQSQLADAVRSRRKEKKWSREVLAERSSVPAPTIRKFETTGQISLRQFIMLWQCVDRLETLAEVIKAKDQIPSSIDEVLKG